MEGQKSFQTIAGYAPGTLMLIEKLKAGKRGDVLSDGELREACGEDTTPAGKDTQGSGYGHLLSAIRHVRRHHRLDWVRVKGEGQIKCLAAEETLDHTTNTELKQSRRKARGALRRFATVDTADLPEGRRAEYGVRMIQARMTEMSASTRLKKGLMAREIGDPNKMNMKRLLGMFNGNKPSDDEG